jgi:hypothetical protein
MPRLFAGLAIGRRVKGGEGGQGWGGEEQRRSGDRVSWRGCGRGRGRRYIFVSKLFTPTFIKID